MEEQILVPLLFESVLASDVFVSRSPTWGILQEIAEMRAVKLIMFVELHKDHRKFHVRSVIQSE